MHGWDLGNGTCWLKCGLCSQNWGCRMAGAAGPGALEAEMASPRSSKDMERAGSNFFFVLGTPKSKVWL